ncbi:WAS/WASL-interacting protein family member 3 isoform X2 [Heterocephalus glaber]|uniref:WAS/WASL-interacting protein family member 3 isoform X2 n=1 Tax=Heterocephalus glaber TaxID=10181 RepID=A0AAX6SJ80_HETGA|nr:WAS/WASL-interacting protein family member 3 isoform X2 [Heterocephalus glaber]
MPVPPPPPPPLPPPPPPPGAPPPPPPSAPPVNTDTSSLGKADPKGRSALLADIQQGTRLRKVTQINDRSAPQIESSKGTNKEGGGPVNSRGGSTPPALGDLFAGGFPVLRPAGQRDAAGGKAGQGPGSRLPSPRLPTKTLSGALNPPASPRLGTASEGPGAPRTVPPRPSVPAPPPPPPPPLPPPLPPSSPSKTPLVSPPGPPSKGSPAVAAPPLPCTPPPPPPTPPPLPPAPAPNDKAVRPPLAPLHLPPVPPPLPLLPPCGYPGLNSEPASPAQEVRELPAPPPPPPPPPLPPFATCSPRASAPAPPAPAANCSTEAPPPPPPKSPSFQAQPQKASVQALPAPPGPPGSQPLVQKKRIGRGPGTGGGKLNPPPAPPARSPTTELSSKSQQAPAWTPTPQPGGQLRNGSLHIINDFESKFTFHSVEEFPPPDEYKPSQKIYPSKIPRSRTPGPWLQAEAAGQSSDDIKGRNSQVTNSSRPSTNKDMSPHQTPDLLVS